VTQNRDRWHDALEELGKIATVPPAAFARWWPTPEQAKILAVADEVVE
jgi:hypothetical protein